MTQHLTTDDSIFYTQKRFSEQKGESPRGRLLIASCRSGTYLARDVIKRYNALLNDSGEAGQVLYLEDIDFQFSDSETNVRLDLDVSGHDVFLLQALYDPTSERSVDENYMAMLISARAFREWGANQVTAVVPYLAYTRQDKPTRFEREPTTARLMADLSARAGINRLVTWHPHSPQIHGFYNGMPIDKLESLALFANAFQRFEGREDVVVVAPDAGASKFVTYFSRQLNLNSAIASKHRPRPEQAKITEIIGDFSNKKVALVLDDMISSGGTVYKLIKKLVEAKGIEEVYLGISHNLCIESAYERLQELHSDYGLKQLVITNSIPQTARFQSLPFIEIRSLSHTLAWVINRIHYNRSLDTTVYRGP